MDPVGPWTAAYAASYNRLAGAAGGFQTGAGNSGEFPHHLAATPSNSASNPSTTSHSQLLLQAAHATSTLTGLSAAGPSTAFNPGSFLSPPTVGYDSVFSPFLHHANQKAHYTQTLNAAQHRQAVANTKPSPGETEPSIHHHQTLASNPPYFDQPHSTVQTSTLPWTHQNNPQLPSPFGVLPHESVVGNRPCGPPSKLSSAYENLNAAHFAAQTLNHINSQLVVASYGEPTKKLVYTSAPSPPLKSSSASNVTSGNYFQQGSPMSYSRPDNQSAGFPVVKAHSLVNKPEYGGSSENYTSSSNTAAQQQPTHSVPSKNSPSKDYVPQPLARTSSTAFPSKNSDQHTSRSNFQPPSSKQCVNNPVLLNKLQSNSDRRDSTESNQSSPISYAMIDSAHIRPAHVMQTTTVVSQHLHQPLNQQKSFRGFTTSTGTTSESEYSQGVANRSVSSDGGYSSSSSGGLSGTDCNNIQKSPLGHVTSPAAYPAYHSPMTSMSSPSPVNLQHSDQNCSYKQNPSPQVAPPSPLDASLPRPSSVGHAQYSSVITRNEQSFSSDNHMEFPSKHSWDTGNQQHLRSKYSGYSGTEALQNPSSVLSKQQKTQLDVADRQSSFDPSLRQTTIINNKGDPMSIVKNLQTVNQNALSDIKIETNSNSGNNKKKSPIRNSSTTTKKKKGTDKRVEMNKSVLQNNVKVPPPAHLNTSQNCGYTGFDRANMSSMDKCASDSTNSYSSQNFANVGGNGINPLIAPHLNQHLASHPPYNSTHQNTIASQQNLIRNYNNPQTNLANNNETYATESRKEILSIPKVIVPNVEEELGFLAACGSKPGLEQKSSKLNPPETKPLASFSSSKSNFMASYLKFLQGEKEPSPPPPKIRTVKPTYVAPIKNEIKTKEKSNAKCTSPSPVTDFEDDPRYFPLPKDPSSRRLDGSSDSEPTDYDVIIPQSTAKPSKPKPQPKKSNKQSRNSSASRESKKRHRKLSDDNDDSDVEKLPRTKRPKRKAKEKALRLKLEDDDDDVYDDINSGTKFSSEISDSDPVWTPKDSDDDSQSRSRSSRGKRRVNLLSKGSPEPLTPPPSRFLESSDEENNATQVKKEPSSCAICNGSCDDPRDTIKCYSCKTTFHCSCCSLATMQKIKKLGSKRHTWKCDTCKAAVANKTGAQANKSKQAKPPKKQVTSTIGTLGTEEYFPYKSGEFIVIKSELSEEYPSLWRVDGKTLLQKYEPFDQNGETLYRNISTYSGWTPQNKNIYEKVPVQFIVQTRHEVIVKFLRSEMVDPVQEQILLEQSLAETAKYQDNFEVYIQTLISQALDSNFLAEIFAEKDEYFLQNVEVIDGLTEDRRQRLVAAVDWPQDSEIQRSVTTWPCYNVLAELKACSSKICDACFRNKVHARIILYGQPYNSTTLDGTTPDMKILRKDFLICLDCIKWVQLYNKLVHQKYIMYIECAKRVAENRSTDPNKDSTVVLNELLADEDWLNKLFSQVRTAWAEVEKPEREKNKKLGESGLQKPNDIVTSQKSIANNTVTVPEENQERVTEDVEHSEVICDREIKTESETQEIKVENDADCNREEGEENSSLNVPEEKETTIEKDTQSNEKVELEK